MEFDKIKRNPEKMRRKKTEEGESYRENEGQEWNQRHWNREEERDCGEEEDKTECSPHNQLLNLLS